MSDKNVFRQSFNRVCALVALCGPGSQSLRPFLHRLRGVKIYGHTFIGQQVILENEYPECIEIHDAELSLRITVMAHFRGHGKVIFEPRSWVGPGCYILASEPDQILTIGEGSAIAACSLITKSVPPYTFMGGIPAKPIAKITVPMTIDTSYEDFKNGLVRLDKK
jgi:acetyltransferase-like isoleucine patch superfamily enzyme